MKTRTCIAIALASLGFTPAASAATRHCPSVSSTYGTPVVQTTATRVVATKVTCTTADKVAYTGINALLQPQFPEQATFTAVIHPAKNSKEVWTYHRTIMNKQWTVIDVKATYQKQTVTFKMTFVRV